jgi:septum formation protein
MVQQMALWVAEEPLVLASKSESRRAVLAGAAIAVEVLPADIDERAIEAQVGSRAPAEVALVLARAKARAVTVQRPGRLVLGADQTLALGDRLFAKPADLAAARDQLKSLRGRTHELHSAVVLARDDVVLFEQCEIARLTMRDFSDRFLDAYIETAGIAVTASVGGYQVEGAGIHLFERIEGDHFTILGLPLLGLLHYLRQTGCVTD